MPQSKVLALDYGKKRIGVASGDIHARVAFPRAVIENKGFSYVAAEVKKIVEDIGATKIVLGIPFNMDDSESKMSLEIRKFAETLSAVTGLDVVFFDERLSSFEADELMKSANKTTRDKKTHRDVYAAQIILQHFFDSI
ncbi:MAG: Holliday junction resolvase RuvX [Candidatus Gracilibacteria bacterium]|jgi:putative Holliday junction resolvase